MREAHSLKRRQFGQGATQKRGIGWKDKHFELKADIEMEPTFSPMTHDRSYSDVAQALLPRESDLADIAIHLQLKHLKKTLSKKEFKRVSSKPLNIYWDASQNPERNSLPTDKLGKQMRACARIPYEHIELRRLPKSKCKP